MPHWRVDLIGKNLQHVGTVEAGTDGAAIEAAMRRAVIELVLRSKVVWRRSSVIAARSEQGLSRLASIAHPILG